MQKIDSSILFAMCPWMVLVPLRHPGHIRFMVFVCIIAVIKMASKVIEEFLRARRGLRTRMADIVGYSFINVLILATFASIGYLLHDYNR